VKASPQLALPGVKFDMAAPHANPLLEGAVYFVVSAAILFFYFSIYSFSFCFLMG